MKWFKLLLSFSLLVLPLYGCAMGTDYVKVSHTAETPAEKPGKGEVVYVAKAVDNRPEKNLVGQKRNSVGVRMGQVALEKGLNLPDLVTSAVADSLSTYGYIVKYMEEDAAKDAHDEVMVMHTTINEFWTDFSPGFFTVDANANVGLYFELKTSGTDNVAWNKEVFEKATASSALGATPALYEESLNLAFGKALEDFQQGILSAEFRNAVDVKPDMEDTQ